MGRRALRNFGTLPVETIIPDPTQPRAEFDEQEISRLAKSLQEKGQLQPILVRWSETHSKWIVVYGERRYRATLVAGLPTINCQFQESELEKGEILERQLIENLLREDLKPIEEAVAFDQLLKQNGWTGKELSEAIHVSASRITRALALLTLPADIQQLVESGQLAARTAYEISKLPGSSPKSVGKKEMALNFLNRSSGSTKGVRPFHRHHHIVLTGVKTNAMAKTEGAQG